jgi:hypothetical protein
MDGDDLDAEVVDEYGDSVEPPHDAFDYANGYELLLKYMRQAEGRRRDCSDDRDDRQPWLASSVWSLARPTTTSCRATS